MSKKKKESSFKDKITSTKSLTIIFICMVVLVLILGGILVYRSINKKPSANMFIAIMDKDKRYSFHINAEALEDNSYLLKITNYRGDNVLNKDVNYSITISNPNDSILSVKRLDNFEEVGKELMMEQDSTKIENQILKKDEKNEIWYKISFSKIKKKDKKDLISVVIES